MDSSQLYIRSYDENTNTNNLIPDFFINGDKHKNILSKCILLSNNIKTLIEENDYDKAQEQEIELNKLKFELTTDYSLFNLHMKSLEEANETLFYLNNKHEYVTIPQEQYLIYIDLNRIIPGWYPLDNKTINKINKIQKYSDIIKKYVFCYSCFKCVTSNTTSLTHVMKYETCDENFICSNIIAICKRCITFAYNNRPPKYFEEVKKKYYKHYEINLSLLYDAHRTKLNENIELCIDLSKSKDYYFKIINEHNDILLKLNENKVNINENKLKLSDSNNKLKTILNEKHIINKQIIDLENEIKIKFNDINNNILGHFQNINSRNITCNICYDNNITHTLSCGHTLCGECMERLDDTCFSCRQRITSTIKLFF